MREVAIPSAGNAGSATAAYAAAAGIPAHVVVPRDTPKPIVEEMHALGADVELIDGLITDAAVRVAAGAKAHGWFELSTLKEPYRVEGNKTMGYELFEQLGGFPEEFSGSEDIAFAWKAHLAGVRVHFVGDAVYFYRHRESLGDLFRQAANWGRDNALLYARFGPQGMPARSWRLTVREWTATLRDVVVARGEVERGQAAVRLGFCVGRFKGSAKYRVRYL